MLLPTILLLPFTFCAESNPSLFDLFFKGVMCASSIEQTPMYTWMVPDWLRHLSSLNGELCDPEVVIEDPEWEKELEGLRSPFVDLPPKYDSLTGPITVHLTTLYRRVLHTLEHGSENKKEEGSLLVWKQGLKQFTSQVARKARQFPAWLEKAKPTKQNARIFALMIGLLQGGIIAPPNPDQSLRSILTGESELDNIAERARLFSWLIREARQIIPNQTMLSAQFRLLSITATANLNTEHLLELTTMISNGTRFTFARRSMAIVDLIKRDGGNDFYGLVYTPRDVIAFNLPTHSLPQLIQLEDYEGLEHIAGLNAKVVNPPWYPQLALPLVQRYSMAWAPAAHYEVGAIWWSCQQLSKGVEVKEADFIISLILKLDSTMAKALYSRVLLLNPVSTLLGEIRRAINARI